MQFFFLHHHSKSVAKKRYSEPSQSCWMLIWNIVASCKQSGFKIIFTVAFIFEIVWMGEKNEMQHAFTKRNNCLPSVSFWSALFRYRWSSYQMAVQCALLFLHHFLCAEASGIFNLAQHFVFILLVRAACKMNTKLFMLSILCCDVFIFRSLFFHFMKLSKRCKTKLCALLFI